MNKLPTSIEIRLPRGSMRRWHLQVVETLAADPGVHVRCRLVDPGPAAPSGLDLLFAFERIFVGRDVPMAADRIADPREDEAAASDLVIDLASGGDRPTVPTLRPTCLDRRPLEGALAAVLGDHLPVLAVDLVEGEGARRLGLWPVAIEDRVNVLRATTMVLGRLAHMVITAARACLAAPAPRDARLSSALGLEPVAPRAIGAPAITALFLRELTTRIAAKLTRLAGGRRPDWRTVWRMRAPGADPLAPNDDPTPFRLVPDDGARFFADPFLWADGDRALLFMEEYPYATGRGILSLAEVGADGSLSAPRPILEQDCHLSYPQVFAHDGRMWMVPETSGRGTVELWRAEHFPDDWRLHTVLLEGVDLADATIEEIDGRWWMFGTARCPFGSSWDALHVYSAPALEGPWTPLSRDPQVVDVRAARPAGRMIRDGAGWLRPVQDSSRGYGGGLALARVDRLDETGLVEHLETRFATPAPLTGLHTWNRVETARGLVETLDIFCDARDYGEARRLDLAPRRVGPSAETA